MFKPLKTLKEAEEYKYNLWAGNPEGWKYDPEKCAYEVYDRFSGGFYQCLRKKKTGPDGLYCTQHAKMIEKQENGEIE